MRVVIGLSQWYSIYLNDTCDLTIGGSILIISSMITLTYTTHNNEERSNACMIKNLTVARTYVYLPSFTSSISLSRALKTPANGMRLNDCKHL
jgi:hypothetical protein